MIYDSVCTPTPNDVPNPTRSLRGGIQPPPRGGGVPLIAERDTKSDSIFDGMNLSEFVCQTTNTTKSCLKK